MVNNKMLWEAGREEEVGFKEYSTGSKGFFGFLYLFSTNIVCLP